MKHKNARTIITLLGMLLGAGVASLFANSRLALMIGEPWLVPAAYVGAAVLFGIISFFFAPNLIVLFEKFGRQIEKRLNALQMADIVFAMAGLLVGLIIAVLISSLLRELPYPLFLALSVILYIALGWFFMRLFKRRWSELPFLSQMKRPERSIGERRAARVAERSEETVRSDAKLLDSSVLIDARIVDICKTGFLEGTLIVPQFIVEELQRVADSADALKRTRGRRGLDVINQLRALPGIKIEAGGYEDTGNDEVDMKLLKLTRQMDGKVVTNDYNLNKVAELSGVKVLNINALSNALKPTFLPGEELQADIIKEGKENNQGVAYLSDGTMIVVENGRAFIGQKVPVVVTSVLQTSAGRMIFAKTRES